MRWRRPRWYARSKVVVQLGVEVHLAAHVLPGAGGGTPCSIPRAACVRERGSRRWHRCRGRAAPSTRVAARVRRGTRLRRSRHPTSDPPARRPCSAPTSDRGAVGVEAEDQLSPSRVVPGGGGPRGDAAVPAEHTHVLRLPPLRGDLGAVVGSRRCRPRRSSVGVRVCADSARRHRHRWAPSSRQGMTTETVTAGETGPWGTGGPPGDESSHARRSAAGVSRLDACVVG